MFAPADTPRVIGVPPGADFVRTLFDHLIAAFDGQPPEALAQVQILTATNRMRRRLVSLFEQDDRPRLLPRIAVVSDVVPLIPGADLPAPVSSLRRSLELKELVARLVALDDRLSPHSVVDLTESLAALFDEMQSEGVPLDALDNVSADDASGHWQRSLAFLHTIGDYAKALASGTADQQTTRRLAVEALCARWSADPPETPVIVAGSTGSRAMTRMLMTRVARLPHGAVLLPGFDFDLPDGIWEALSKSREAEDHPQYRFAALLKDLGLKPCEVTAWSEAPARQRNRLISLSLRPPSVTDQWRAEGPRIGDPVRLTGTLALIEAEETRQESLAIATAMRVALDAGETVALIAPDATLARRVAAALNRWGIVPDDSGGEPLSLTPPGRFLRQIAGLIGRPADPVDLLALLKHPLTRKDTDRGDHLLTVQRFEAFLRKAQAPQVDAALVQRFNDAAFVSWLVPLLDRLDDLPAPTLAAALDHHLSLAEDISAGDALWSGKDGEKVWQVVESFRAETAFTGPLNFNEYRRFLDRALASDSHRDPAGLRPDAMIWGTLEARVQGADTVILGGLNEGTWPQEPGPDPWLNRRMRREAGLLLPERQIGLAAHDYQQAVGAKRVILSRARRVDGTETVPSRWLNRLTNLMNGLPGGEEALKAMSARGARYIATADALDHPEGPDAAAPRPAPSPPLDLRPLSFAVTAIRTLIRDPYAIYARRILRLRPLDPLLPEPDARMRGIVIHQVLRRVFSLDADFSDAAVAARRLETIVAEEMARAVPWPAIRAEWQSGLLRITDWLVATEQARLAGASPLKREVPGRYPVPGTTFEITGQADRIDRLETGELVIYDYKTGAPPSPREILHFDRQLPIEAVMAEAGAFEGIDPETVARVVHLGVGRSPKEQVTELAGRNETVTVSGELAQFLTRYLSREVGYLALRAMETQRYESDYTHLARFGEWSYSDEARVEPLA